MAITDLNTLQARRKDPSQRVPYIITYSPSINSSQHRYRSWWKASGGLKSVGATPTTSAAVDNTTSGVIAQNNGASTPLRITSLQNSFIVSSDFGSAQGMFILCDRLNHSGGLDGTVTSAQTTNLPTAALTRYTDGVGVMACVEIYSALGTNAATTATISYTNQAGTSGQTSPAFSFGGSNNRGDTIIYLIPLAAGDTGVKSVESITLAASTGTAGNFGITLYKPLLAIPTRQLASGISTAQLEGDLPVDPILSGASLSPEIVDGTAFWLISISGALNFGTHTISGMIELAED